MIDKNVHWLLSFYRISEISGALFFGQLARTLKPGPIQCDMSRHFADEAQHARYLTDCMSQLGVEPLKLGESYQDRYLAEAGLPANLMEILAITQVFEFRVIGQYARHRQLPALETEISDTITRIMVDERWHIRWVRNALKTLEAEYGASTIKSTIQRYQSADQAVFRQLVAEHGDRLQDLFQVREQRGRCHDQ